MNNISTEKMLILGAAAVAIVSLFTPNGEMVLKGLGGLTALYLVGKFFTWG